MWRRVDAVVEAGLWATTTFVLAYDDWGGYADHVLTPASETVVDALHPRGFPVIGGSRLPLVMFGGRVTQAIDNTWHSNASIPKTVMDLLGLPPFGVPRVDTAPSLARFVDPALRRPPPPRYGRSITQPRPPSARPQPVAPPPWKGLRNRALAPLVLKGGRMRPAPEDAVVCKAPPELPPQAPRTP